MVSSLLACSGVPPEPAAPPTALRAPTALPARGEPQPAAQFAFRSADRRERLRRAFPAIDEALAKRAKEAKTPGYAFALVIDGELAHVFSYGVADTATGAVVDGETRFRVGSISKTFTALALAKLRDEGKLASFEEPIDSVLPEALSLRAAAADAGPVRIRDITLHQSGLVRTGSYDEMYAKPIGRAELLSSLALPSLSTPYEGYSYSNYGFGLLGLVVENLSGVGYGDYVERDITKPLGLASVAWTSDSVPAAHRAYSYNKKGEREAEWRLGALDASGGLFMSAPDAARWAGFHAEAFPPRDTKDSGPVKRATVRELLTLGTSDAPNDENRVMSHSALGWDSMQACGERIFLKGGLVESFMSQAVFLPDHGVAFASIANTRMGLFQPHADVLAALRATGALERREKQPGPELARAMDNWLDVFTSYDTERFARAYTQESVRNGDEKERADWHKKQRERLGSCERESIDHVDHAGAGRFRLRCERGTATISISLDPSLRLITHSGNQWRYKPTGAQQKQVESAFALLSKNQSIWGSDATPEQKASLASLRKEFGKLSSCKLGDASETGNPDETLFHVGCADGQARRLRLSFAEGDSTKITRAAMEPALRPAEPCKSW